MIIEKTYTPQQIAEILQVREYSVRRWLRQGELKGFQLGGRWRVKESDLKAFMDSR